MTRLFSNRASPPAHRSCQDPLCLVCLRAEREFSRGVLRVDLGRAMLAGIRLRRKWEAFRLYGLLLEEQFKAAEAAQKKKPPARAGVERRKAA